MDFTEKLVKPLKNRIPFQKVTRFCFYDAHSGKPVLDIPDTGWGGYLVDRQRFDREIALMALEAGAQIVINTKAVGLVRDGSRVVGVETTHSDLRRIKAEVVYLCGWHQVFEKRLRSERVTQGGRGAVQSDTVTGVNQGKGYSARNTRNLCKP